MSIPNTRNRANAGYTIDQTILIVAIIAILVTLIIITIGWQLISRAGGARLASQMRQVEDSIGNFYSDNRAWPNDAATAANFANGMVLAGVVTPTTVGSTAKNYLPGLRASGNVLYHNLSTSSNVVTFAETANPYGNQGNFIVVQFQNVPQSEVREAEEAIDGRNSASYGTGRFVATTTACAAGSGAAMTSSTAASTQVYACYVGNNIQ